MSAPQEEYMYCGSLANTECMQMSKQNTYARENNKVQNTNCFYVLILPFL